MKINIENMTEDTNKKFIAIVNEIKKEIKTTQIKIVIEVNKNLINLYFKIGKILNDNYKYGNKFIDYISRVYIITKKGNSISGQFVRILI